MGQWTGGRGFRTEVLGLAYRESRSVVVLRSLDSIVAWSPRIAVIFPRRRTVLTVGFFEGAKMCRWLGRTRGVGSAMVGLWIEKLFWRASYRIRRWWNLGLAFCPMHRLRLSGKKERVKCSTRVHVTTCQVLAFYNPPPLFELSLLTSFLYYFPAHRNVFISDQSQGATASSLLRGYQM